MDLANIQADDFNPWEVPLTPDQIAKMSFFYERLGHYRERLHRQVGLMHRARLKSREAAKLPRPEAWNRTTLDAEAACRFGHIEDDLIRYSGQTWFRGESDSFSTEECDPLPLSLLAADEATIVRHFTELAKTEREVLDQKQQAADAVAALAREAAEKAEFERLRLKFGSV